MAMEFDLKVILGHPSGGPSVSVDEDTGEFILYEWNNGDLWTELARGKTLRRLISDYKGKDYGK
jgi:hypothetical protein